MEKAASHVLGGAKVGSPKHILKMLAHLRAEGDFHMAQRREEQDTAIYERINRGKPVAKRSR